MNKYESIMILKNDVTNEKRIEIYKKIADITCGFASFEEMGERKLAYSVNGQDAGFYVSFDFYAMAGSDGTSVVVTNLEQFYESLTATGEVLRNVIVTIEHNVTGFNDFKLNTLKIMRTLEDLETKKEKEQKQILKTLYIADGETVAEYSCTLVNGKITHEGYKLKDKDFDFDRDDFETVYTESNRIIRKDNMTINIQNMYYRDDLFEVETRNDTYYFFNETDAFDNDFEKCDECGYWFDYSNEGFRVDGNYYCSDECAENAGYVQCNDCGEWENSDYIIHTGNDRYICRNCIDDYIYCENCDEYYPYNDGVYDEESDCYYCQDCYEQECGDSGHIHSYHTAKDGNKWSFLKTDEDIPRLRLYRE